MLICLGYHHRETWWAMGFSPSYPGDDTLVIPERLRQKDRLSIKALKLAWGYTARLCLRKEDRELPSWFSGLRCLPLIHHSMDSSWLSSLTLVMKGDGAQLAGFFCHVFVSFVSPRHHLLTILSQNPTE